MAASATRSANFVGRFLIRVNFLFLSTRLSNAPLCFFLMMVSISQSPVCICYTYSHEYNFCDCSLSTEARVNKYVIVEFMEQGIPL